jgi:hypothetical protein
VTCKAGTIYKNGMIHERRERSALPEGAVAVEPLPAPSRFADQSAACLIDAMSIERS